MRIFFNVPKRMILSNFDFEINHDEDNPIANYISALDYGVKSSRAILFDEAGRRWSDFKSIHATVTGVQL